MFIFFKIMIKSICIVVGLLSIVALSFMPAIYAAINIGSIFGAAWLVFYLIVFMAVMISLSQENEFSEKVEKASKAFWNW